MKVFKLERCSTEWTFFANINHFLLFWQIKGRGEELVEQQQKVAREEVESIMKQSHGPDTREAFHYILGHHFQWTFRFGGGGRGEFFLLLAEHTTRTKGAWHSVWVHSYSCNPLVPRVKKIKWPITHYCAVLGRLRLDLPVVSAQLDQVLLLTYCQLMHLTYWSRWAFKFLYGGTIQLSSKVSSWSFTDAP